MPWFVVVAAAEDPDTGEVELAPADPVPSAVDGIDAAAGETEGAELLAAIEDWVPLRDDRLRGKPFVRPVLGGSTHGGRAAVRVGAAVGHAWWTLADHAARLGGESALRLTAPVGGAAGWRVELGTQAGPWLGPVGLTVGPVLRAERERWDEEELGAALLGGGIADVSLDAGPVGVFVGVEPLAALAGGRAPAVGGPLPALGAETAWRAGVRFPIGPAQIGVELADRQTPIGSVVEAGFRLRLELL